LTSPARAGSAIDAVISTIAAGRKSFMANP
jgi:hypothetical protein